MSPKASSAYIYQPPRGTQTKGRLNNDKAVISAQKKTQTLQKAALKQAMKALSSGGPPAKAVGLADIVAECFNVFRGARGFARRLYIQFIKAPSGSATRTKILDIMLKMAMAEASRSGTGGVTEVGDMTDAEIAEEESRIMEQGMAKDHGDPRGMGEALELEDAIESEEADDPEIKELDDEIRRMEAIEENEDTDLKDLIGKLADATDEEFEEDEQSADDK